ncbi:MAG: hypothetical protein KF819_05055 [Labilithrix sp.]|nr:hypothetical protein [Labilithrix sp.]
MIARALFAVLLAALAGCAFIPSTVSLDAPRSRPRASAPTGPRVLVVGPFVDARHERGRCGMKKNGYNGDLADVFCDAPPASWIAARLTGDLRAAGLDAVEPPESAPIRVEGTLLQFFTEPRIGGFTLDQETDIHVKLRVTSSDGLVAERELYVKGVETSIAADDETIQASVDDASRRIAEAMSRAVVSLVTHVPRGPR